MDYSPKSLNEIGELMKKAIEAEKAAERRRQQSRPKRIPKQSPETVTTEAVENNVEMVLQEETVTTEAVENNVEMVLQEETVTTETVENNVEMVLQEETVTTETVENNVEMVLQEETVTTDNVESNNLLYFVGRTTTKWQEFHALYKQHAAMIGFSFKLSTTRRFKNGSEKEKYFVCSAEGCSVADKPSPMGISPIVINDGEVKKKKKRRKTKIRRTGCKAGLRVSYVYEGCWKVEHHIIEHNHELSRPEWSHLYRPERKITKEKGEIIECMEESRLKPSDSYRVLMHIAGGREHVGHTTRDHINYVNRLRADKTGGADAQHVIEMLQKRQKEDPDFYYKPMLDEESRLCGLFWCDWMMREDYRLYGDVLVFDTTYRTNRYDMICAPFVGINNHWNNCMFGCAFLANEEAPTFVWLFETFLEAMGKKKPVTMFTDQYKAMNKAIKQVFGAETRHRLCVWHIEQNFTSHCGVLKTNKEFKKAFLFCLKVCKEEEEFEIAWNELVETYKLYDEEDSWFKKLYDLRGKWCRALNKDVFSAGILSSQRSESTNHAISFNSTKQTSLTMFFGLFDEIMERWRSTEIENEHICTTSTPRLYSQHNILKQAAQVYTITIFERFQTEFIYSFPNSLKKQSEDGNTIVYLVQPHDDTYGGDSTVTFSAVDDKIEVRCTCMLFEERGWLCRHSLRVFQQHDVLSIPNDYILGRWTKDLKSQIFYMQKEKTCVGQKAPDCIAWRHQMSRSYFNLVIKAEGDEKTRKIIEDSYKKALDEVDAVMKKMEQSTHKDTETQQQGDCGTSQVVLNPREATTKGRKRAPRIKNHIEKTSKKKKSTEQQHVDTFTRREHII